MELQLHQILVDVGQGKTALGVDADYAGPRAEFGTRVFVSPDIV
jgi:hypothetical protein